MKLHLEATEEELREKGPLLLRTIADRVAAACPEHQPYAELVKALVPKAGVTFRPKVLDHLEKEATKLFQVQMEEMKQEIADYLDSISNEGGTP